MKIWSCRYHRATRSDSSPPQSTPRSKRLRIRSQASSRADASARDDEWLKIRSRFERGVDWSGLERERVARWYRQLHIFMYPFYYIEYGIAQLGALQIWRNSLRDPAEAVARYREALALGAVRSLPEMYRAAGAQLTFDPGLIGELVDLVEQQGDRIRTELRGAAA